MGQTLWTDDNGHAWAVGKSFDSGETSTHATPGTPVSLLGSALATLSVIIIADSTNTDSVHIGGSDVDYSTNKGLQLTPGSAISIDFDNSKKQIYIDSETAAQKVNWMYIVN